MVDKYNNMQLFTEQLLKDYKEKITGENIKRVIGKKPEDKFYVGKLSTVKSSDLDSNVIINQIGIDFLINKEDLSNTKISISPKGDLYYRVNPKIEEQRHYTLNEINQNNDDVNYNDFEEILSEENDLTKYKSEVVEVYKSFSLLDYNLNYILNLDKLYNNNKKIGIVDEKHDINKRFAEDINNIEEEISNDSEVYKYIREEVYLKDLISSDTWESFIKKNESSIDGRVMWSLKIRVEIKPYKNNYYRVSVTLVNDTPENNLKINTLFNSGLEVEIIGSEFEPLILDYFKDDYKYNKEQYGIGTNCTVIKKDNSNTLSTTHLPIYRQYRLKPKVDLSVKFEDLINNTNKTLNNIYQEMINELAKWEERYDDISSSLTIEGKKQFKQEIEDFKLEKNRFKHGVEIIKNYEEIKSAFLLMNKTFFNTNKNFDSWRLFQIVFIVSLIPDIAECEDGLLLDSEKDKSNLENVDLLYFPTGGGKTEAFLGVVVFNLFFDRIRQKLMGTTSLIKYPLRLLSIQQVQRIANILATANNIKNKNNIKGKEFSLGYYVGSQNTPNRLEKNIEAELRKGQEQLNEDYKILELCPNCGSENINIKILKNKNRLIHECDNSSCSYDGPLPIYIVDQEIYRYLPSVIVSTIDKQAALGYQSNFRNVLGEPKLFECSDHGFTSKNKCLVKGCENNFEDFKTINIHDPAPSLMIQDELHLLRESLGVYDAHYETFMQYYINNLSKSKRPLKIIGATATITSYHEQIYHLYNGKPIRFPSESPFLDEDFYSYVDKDELHRIILGLAPFGKAIVNSVAYSLKYLKEILWNYYNDLSKVLSIEGMELSDEEEAKEILDFYWMILQYNNVKSDANRVINAIDDPINVELENEKVQPFEIRKMTGDDTFQDVRRILAEIENKESMFEGFNMITATSMISHGVDADRFNQMLFFGIPRHTAEYIQAYSRVGRKYPGFIIMIMRPTRERDQSYLRNFIKFHEFKDILVEPVPVNRWATKAVDKTLPGIISGLLINYYDSKEELKDHKIYMMQSLQSAIQNELIEKQEFKNHIYKIYGCIDSEGEKEIGRQYRQRISKIVDEFFDKVTHENYSREKNPYITKGIGELLTYKPMFSLRDTDEDVKVALR
ncbi:hypothetical protein I0Q91_00365 [Halanaerobiaceae bacterium Z-7014]|uniref:Helicase C-terminal domain-containing protein n=1 Tax=Halonatronomonas betaini TaxID=2778430 RepID=A0A931AMM4_9FIRM|nr:helicase-related protein [Halonatronomonas betaini]MBF8435517.1 hypothetical protein [Halonatronomonas betaini]